ncbi:GNAT family N-acetyltransferase, partial [Pleomorphomonas oryzae]|uniref:GNAT family N-acetyltransferase n=1 Tax=Pleomorphomonas oryzae TaxID=261934 RepID=UPI00146EB329
MTGSIVGNRIELRPCVAAHIPGFIEGLNDWNVAQWLPTVPFPYTEADACAFIASAAQAVPPNAFAVVHRLEGEFLGVVGLVRSGDVAELGYWLLPRFHGRGLMTEAVASRAPAPRRIARSGLRDRRSGQCRLYQASRKERASFDRRACARDAQSAGKYCCPSLSERSDLAAAPFQIQQSPRRFLGEGFCVVCRVCLACEEVLTVWFDLSLLSCSLQAWQRPTLPRLKTEYHWRW